MSAAGPANAFCGFYISGADARLFNNATMVVMMRDGLRTVLSMQNNYEGPPDDRDYSPFLDRRRSAAACHLESTLLNRAFRRDTPSISR